MFDLSSLYASPLEGEGIFVVIEGIDGAGKTIQATRLVQNMLVYGHLGGVDQIHPMRQPTRERYGMKIRDFAQNAKSRNPLVEFSLFLADRMEQAEVIRRLIKQGNTIVMDRCYHSSVAYQSATGELDAQGIFQSNRIFFPKPDLFVLIDIPASVAMTRLEKRNQAEEIFEQKEFLEKARQTYLDLARIEEGVVINGDQPIDKVEADIWDAFMAFLPNRSASRL